MLLVLASGFEEQNTAKILLFLTGGKDLNSNSNPSHLNTQHLCLDHLLLPVIRQLIASCKVIPHFKRGTAYFTPVVCLYLRSHGAQVAELAAKSQNCQVIHLKGPLLEQ